MSDRETGRISNANADDSSADSAADDSRLRLMDENELSSEELDGVGGGLRAAKTDEDQGPDGRYFM